MKAYKLFFILLLPVYVHGQTQPDSIWNKFDYSEHTYVDKSKGYPITMGEKKYDIDSSKWHLQKIVKNKSGTNYYYIRIFSYGVAQIYRVPPDTLAAWKKNCKDTLNIICMANYPDGWSDLMGYYHFEHGKSMRLIDGTKVQDTAKANKPFVLTIFNQ